MNVSLYEAAAAMNASSRWQETIADNLSSASVPGFRKQDITFSAVEAGLDPSAASINAPRYVIPSAQVSTNFKEGELNPTGNKMDFAIQGPAMFEVKLRNDTKAYTRDGQFKLNAQGQLVTKQGYVVMGDSGPLQLDAGNSEPISVSPGGDVSQGGAVIGRMRIAEFSDPQSLTSIGQGFFVSGSNIPLPNNVMASSIRQGFVEASNSSSMVEMSDLITAMRMFESNQKVLQMHDDRMGQVISQLGNPT